MSTSITHRSGTLLSASPPRIRPRLIEGRSNSSELCRANGSDSILRKTSIALEHGVVAQPRRRPVGGDPRHLQAQRQHSLRLDPDVQVGRLAGDREVADEAAVDEVVAAALGLLLGLLVADDPEPDPDPVLVAHRRRCRPASPPARPSCRRRRGRRGGRPRSAGRTGPARPGTTSRWPWRTTVGAPAAPTSALSTGSPRTSSAIGLDPPRLQPALDEPGGLQNRLRLGGVIADQPLGERHSSSLIGIPLPRMGGPHSRCATPAEPARDRGREREASIARRGNVREARDMQSGCCAGIARAPHPRRAKRGASIPAEGYRRPSSSRDREEGLRAIAIFSALALAPLPSSVSERRRSASASCSFSERRVEVLGRDRLLDQQPGVVAEDLQPAVGLGVADGLGVAQTWRRSSAGRSAASSGAWLARMPISPTSVRVETWRTSPLKTSPSGVRTSTSNLCSAATGS